MKYLQALLFFSLFPFVAHAVPARRVQRTITLADGSQKTVTLRGDENFHFFQSADGLLYRGDERVGFTPLDQSLATRLWSEQTERRQRGRRGDDASRPLPSASAPLALSPQDAAHQPSALLTQAASPRSRRAGTRIATVGQRRGLVILVNFSDRKMTLPAQEFDDYFNQQGYSNYGMGGSVHDYFFDCSYGQFDLAFDVIGPVTVSQNMQYYGKNDATGNDIHPAEMVSEAVLLADELGTDFSQYDWDGDGSVDQVYVIYAGYGESSGAPSTTIWPHEYQLDYANYYGDGNGPIKIDGVTVNTYACSNELYGTSGKTIDGIGTACHEFSHCLGLPDFYNTTANTFGMDLWSVLDYGCYGDDGRCPVGYTSYERWVCGWLEPVVLKDPLTVDSMPSIATSPVAYVIYNDKYRNEYYLLENRQKVGWHRFDKGHGMLILHVDYNYNAWFMNEVNTATRQRMTIIPADNNFLTNAAGLAGDPWPGTKRKTELTDDSTPAAILYNVNRSGKKLMGKPITGIAEDIKTRTISFLFMGGTVPDALTPPAAAATPSATAAYNLDGTPFRATQSRGLYIQGGKKKVAR